MSRKMTRKDEKECMEFIKRICHIYGIEDYYFSASRPDGGWFSTASYNKKKRPDSRIIKINDMVKEMDEDNWIARGSKRAAEFIDDFLKND